MADLKIFTNNIEEKAEQQIDLLLQQDAFKNCKVRIMPDVHAGAGCVIGFTADLGHKVIPNIVGVDIGCGMTWVQTSIKASDLDLKVLDKIIHDKIPAGREVAYVPNTIHSMISEGIVRNLKCNKLIKNPQDYLQRSLGTLGGGNHFIEVDVNESGNCVFVVHSGSRNLGKQVCDIYQQKAIKHCSYDDELKEKQIQLIKELKEKGQQYKIEQAIKDLKEQYVGKTKLPKDLCYLEGQDAKDYLHDMKLCQQWASHNRRIIMETILHELYKECNVFVNSCWNETIHNYIDANNVVRKGAISAKYNEVVLIPINMKDGCIVAVGKGNTDWNCSAPHGAGRIMSRHEARQRLTVEQYTKEMCGIYTTCIGTDTIDEAPMAYKPIQEIIDNIKDTVDIVEIIKPVYNFKAGQ